MSALNEPREGRHQQVEEDMTYDVFVEVVGEDVSAERQTLRFVDNLLVTVVVAWFG